MFNPFTPFIAPMIPGFIKMKRIYFVTQTNKAAVVPISFDDKTPILLTDYEDIGLAKIHYNALSDDKYKAILNLDKPEHYAKLQEMLKPDSKYTLWSAFVKRSDHEKGLKLLNDKYHTNIKNFVSQRTNWRIERGQTLRPSLQVIFGELFVILKWSGQQVKLRLSELQKF